MVFILSPLWWRRITGLWKLPDGRDWLKGKLGLVLMGGSMLSNSLIQFSIDGQGYVPSLLFDLRPNCGEVMKIMVTCFKRSHVCTAALSALTLQQATTDPCLCWRLLDTHRQVWVSLFWGHCSFLLGPGAHKVLFVPSKSLFPQSCVSSGGSIVGLMATFFQEGWCHAQVCCTQNPWPCGSPPYLYRRHSNPVLSQSLWGLWVLVCTRFVWALRVSLVGMGFDSKHDFTPPIILMGLLLCPWVWVISSELLQCHTDATLAPTVLLGFLWPWMWGISLKSF